MPCWRGGERLGGAVPRLGVPTLQSDRAGLLYALAGFCTLSIGDAIIKGMAGEWPAPAMAATRYVAGTLVGF